MTGPLALFYVAGALALVGAAGAVTRRDPAAAIGWYVAALAGAATIAVMVQAPLPAIVLALASAWGLALLALAARGHQGPAAEPDDGAPGAGGRASTIAAGIGLALLAWVLVGTWGRQQAFPGHDLAPGASFGGVRELASAAVGDLAVLWIAAPLLILAAVLAGSALLEPGDEG